MEGTPEIVEENVTENIEEETSNPTVDFFNNIGNLFKGWNDENFSEKLGEAFAELVDPEQKEKGKELVDSISNSMKTMVESLDEINKAAKIEVCNMEIPTNCPHVKVEIQNTGECPVKSCPGIKLCPAIARCPRFGPISDLVNQYRDIQTRIEALNESDRKRFWAQYYEIPNTNNVIENITNLNDKIDDITVELSTIKNNL